jgi:hypothetical protein
MKKTILLLLILCNVLFAYAKDYSSKVFKDCFDKSDESYEFNIRNPFFVEKFYVKDLKKLKNKIIKETIESYYVDEQGRKSYSDSYDRDVVYLYYFFDSEGRITDKYYVNENDKGVVFYKQHESYKCMEETYEIYFEDIKLNNDERMIASVNCKDDCVFLLFDYPYKGFTDLEFRKNSINRRRKTSKTITSIEEVTIKNNNIEIKKYNIRNGKEDYWGITNYQNCYQINQKRFVPSGDEFYEYTLDSNGRGIYTYFKEGKTPEKVIKQEVYRRFNPIGFLEYEEKKPYKTEVGNYSITEVTVLSEKDDFFISHFN